MIVFSLLVRLTANINSSVCDHMICINFSNFVDVDFMYEDRALIPSNSKLFFRTTSILGPIKSTRRKLTSLPSEVKNEL